MATELLISITASVHVGVLISWVAELLVSNGRTSVLHDDITLESPKGLFSLCASSFSRAWPRQAAICISGPRVWGISLDKQTQSTHRVHPHQLRHSHATHTEGVDVFTLQALGHSSSTTTGHCVASNPRDSSRLGQSQTVPSVPRQPALRKLYSCLNF